MRRRSSLLLFLLVTAAVASAMGARTLLADTGAEVVSERLTDALHLLQAAVLGLVEGITEYLPVSSTGHLILVQRMLGIPASEAANSFAICIQAGAIAAVFWLYRDRVAGMAQGLLGRNDTGRRLAFAVGTAFVPAAVLGLLFNDWIEERLFGLWPVTIAWFVGGLAILAVHGIRMRRKADPQAPPRKGLELVTPRMALLIGLAQCLALWPGTSRSLVTIVGGVLVGLSLPAAVEFSFLLGLVTLGAATAYKGLDSGPVMVQAYGWPALTVGFLTAALSAVMAVKWLVSWISTHGIAIFGWYRVALALVVAALLLTGVLPGP